MSSVAKVEVHNVVSGINVASESVRSQTGQTTGNGIGRLVRCASGAVLQTIFHLRD